MHIFFSIYPLNISSARIQNWQDISSVQSGSLRRPPSFPCFVLKLNLWLLWMELWCEWELPRLAASPSRLRIQRCFPFHSVDQALPSGGVVEGETDRLSFSFLFFVIETKFRKNLWNKMIRFSNIKTVVLQEVLFVSVTMTYQV